MKSSLLSLSFRRRKWPHQMSILTLYLLELSSALSDYDTATDSTGAGNGGGANNKQYPLIELQQIYFNETGELIRFKNPS